jgi:hypothetical protein
MKMFTQTNSKQKCQAEEKEERDWARAVPSATERFFVITSRASRSQRSVVSLVEVV